jgi:hypothetical protein
LHHVATAQLGLRQIVRLILPSVSTYATREGVARRANPDGRASKAATPLNEERACAGPWADSYPGRSVSMRPFTRTTTRVRTHTDSRARQTALGRCSRCADQSRCAP